jgi:uncharacterized protein (TIGR03083 family)
MTMAYTEFVSAVRREGEALLSAAGQGGDDPVPTCEGWTIDRLLVHVGRLWTMVATVVGERLTTPPERPEVPQDKPLPTFAADALDDLVEALMSCEPDTPMWNWAGQPPTAMFWARRMANEAAVHRFDAQRAHDVAQPIAAELAHDGLDELIDVILPAVLSGQPRALPEGTYAFDATDEGAWCVQLGADGVSRLDVATTPDVTARGTASALLLAALNRVPWTSLEVEGNASLLDAWSKSLTF